MDKLEKLTADINKSNKINIGEISFNGIETGIKPLDKVLSGGLTIIGAPPAAGKSTLAYQIAQKNVKPLIIVDYLQIIFGGTKTMLSDKQAVDHNIKALIETSSAHGISMLLISSKNRSSYNEIQADIICRDFNERS